MHLLRDFQDEYLRYKIIGEKVFAQIPDEALNHSVDPDHNSIAVLMRHISGNLISRFTDFLETDGEKPWRHRDSEFDSGPFNKRDLSDLWNKGWKVLEKELSKLNDVDMSRIIFIRGKEFTVHEALCRSLAHVSTHIGQMVFLGRILKGKEWKWITIPPGKSEEYNLNPTMEKKPE